MNAEQLLTQVQINRDLITRRNEQAYEHMEMLRKEYAHLITEEIDINLELNNSLMELYFHSNYAAALDNSMKAIEKFKNCNQNTMLVLHMKMVGHCYARTSEFDLAEMYFRDALNTLIVDVETNGIRADILYEMAMTAEFRDLKSKKIKQYLTEAIELLDGEKGVLRKANCVMGLGNYYNNIGDVKGALRHYQEASVTFDEKYLFMHMANCYSNMGSCYVKLNELDEAEQYLNKALELRLRFSSPNDLAISYINLAVLYKARQDLTKAEEYLLITLKMAEELGNKVLLDRVHTLLNEVGMERNKLKAA